MAGSSARRTCPPAQRHVRLIPVTEVRAIPRHCSLRLLRQTRPQRTAAARSVWLDVRRPPFLRFFVAQRHEHMLPSIEAFQPCNFTKSAPQILGISHRPCCATMEAILTPLAFSNWGLPRRRIEVFWRVAVARRGLTRDVSVGECAGGW